MILRKLRLNNFVEIFDLRWKQKKWKRKMLQLADRRTNRIVKIDLEFLTHNLQWRYRLFTKMHYQCMFCDKISPGVHFHTLFEGLRMVYTGVLQAKNKKDAK